MKTLIALMAVTFAFVPSLAQKKYSPGPGSQRYEGIPKGTVTQHTWESTIYPNTVRDYYVYVPAQYDGSQPAALMIFQDGHAYVKEDGEFRVPTVFDNLIAQEKMPVTIGLFINPGHDKNAPAAESPWRVTNRSVEYDEVYGTYADFLWKEMIPELKRTYNISGDPKMHAICGLSSGGICAFTAAWFHPERFHKVLSHIGSFTDIRGGHNYPSMIRKNDRKDIKVFLQDGSHDLDNQFGNWWLANLQMESALKFKDYDYKFVAGEGEHNGNHGGAIMPESLIWLWSDVAPECVESGAYRFSEQGSDHLLFSGETAHFSNAELKVMNLMRTEGKTSVTYPQREQIFIVKEGEVEIAVNGKRQTIGANSVAVLLPGDKGTIGSTSPTAVVYSMAYISKKPADGKRGKKEGGSFIVDFDEVEFSPHDRGGIRNYFRKATTMCPYYEMHITTLNSGIKSHEPHTHRASEIVLMIEGETEMEIGNEVVQASAGDVYFLSSQVPHAIKNIDEKPCMYIAFQWE